MHRLRAFSMARSPSCNGLPIPAGRTPSRPPPYRFARPRSWLAPSGPGLEKEDRGHMTIIKVRKDWKEFAGKHEGPVITRRDMIKMGLATSTATFLLPSMLASLIGRSAYAAATCPASATNETGFTTLYMAGGWNADSVFWPLDPNGQPFGGSD